MGVRVGLAREPCRANTLSKGVSWCAFGFGVAGDVRPCGRLRYLHCGWSGRRVCSEVQVAARGARGRDWRGRGMHFGLAPHIYVRVGASLAL
jgi:hypothetical protein